MGKPIRGPIYLRGRYLLSPLVILMFLIGFASQGVANAVTRDPRQATLLISDFDGSLAKNVGNIRLKRVSTIETASAFFTSISNLPTEIAVPVDDFEGNVGPQISKRLGHIREGGKFIPSASLDPILLSNGQTIIPGYYYLDPQESYADFRPGQDGVNPLIQALEEKFSKKEAFLLEAFLFLSLATAPEYRDRIIPAILTMRGHSPEEMKEAIQYLLKKLKLPKIDWRNESFANLTHPDFIEFNYSKVNYLKRAYHELANRVIVDRSTPHFLILMENDRKFLKETDALFLALSHQGTFANPVVPILVNLVEPEVFRNPDGLDWDRLPMQQITKSARVSIFWPDRVERTDKLSRVLELILQKPTKEAVKMLQSLQKTPFVCASELIRQEGK